MIEEGALELVLGSRLLSAQSCIMAPWFGSFLILGAFSLFSAPLPKHSSAPRLVPHLFSNSHLSSSTTFPRLFQTTQSLAYLDLAFYPQTGFSSWWVMFFCLIFLPTLPPSLCFCLPGPLVLELPLFWKRVEVGGPSQSGPLPHSPTTPFGVILRSS